MPYSGNTTNMRAHIDRKHWSMPMKTEQSLSRPSSSVSSSSSSQASLQSFFKKQEPFSKDRGRAKAISQSIAELVILDMRSLGTVDGTGFNRMINTLEPRYQVLSRNNMLERFIVPMYQMTIYNVKREMSVAKRHAFTTDAWTSINMDSYITTTCHYIDPVSFSLESKVLDAKSVLVSHTAVNLAEEMKVIANKWDFKDPVAVTDNAANIVNACIEAEFPHLGFFGHTLNLAVNRALSVNEVQSLIGKCRKLVSVFKQSYMKSIALKSAEAVLELKQLQVIQDVETRWNSALAMLRRLLEILPALWSVLYKDKKYSHLLPTDSDRKNMEDLQTLLTPIEDATKKVSSEKKPTASLILPIIEKLTSHDLRHRDNDSVFIKKAKDAIRNDLLKRYQKDEEISLLKLATVLDPRFKQLQWLEPVEREKVFNELRVEMLRSEKLQAESHLKIKQEVINTEIIVEDSSPPGPELPKLPDLPQMPFDQPDQDTTATKSESPEAKTIKVKQEDFSKSDDFLTVYL